MKYSTVTLCLAMMCALPGSVFAQAQPPATQPASDSANLKIERRTFPGFTYVFVKAETTAPKIVETIMNLIPKVDTAMASGAIINRGPMIFQYRGATMEHDKPFIIEIGCQVAHDAKAPEGFELRNEPPYSAACAFYIGPIHNIPEAWMKMMADLPALNFKPTPDNLGREFYLYYESPGSPNNITWLQLNVE